MRAPFDGRVVDLDISVGEFATTGRRLFTLVDTRNWYVIANFRETELKHIKPGMPAEVYLMIDNAQRFHGKVHSNGWGVLPEEGTSAAGLPKVPRAINWVRVAQRFRAHTRRRSAAGPVSHRCLGRGTGSLAPSRKARQQRRAHPSDRHDRHSGLGFTPRIVVSVSWKELAPAPDRLNATLRIVLTCVLVVVISMALEIPEMALSVYMVFSFIAKTR
jgi:hypothetical protein